MEIVKTMSSKQFHATLDNLIITRGIATLQPRPPSAQESKLDPTKLRTNEYDHRYNKSDKYQLKQNKYFNFLAVNT
jgi:hypothetical protein